MGTALCPPVAHRHGLGYQEPRGAPTAPVPARRKSGYQGRHYRGIERTDARLNSDLAAITSRLLRPILKNCNADMRVRPSSSAPGEGSQLFHHSFKWALLVSDGIPGV